MTEVTPPLVPGRTPLWRDRRARAVFYQALLLLVVGAVAAWIFRNTLHNLEERGISTGFRFLGEEAGFGISEGLPVPKFRGTVVTFAIVLVLALGAVFALARWAAARGGSIGADTRLTLLTVALVVVIPALVLYFGRDGIESENYTEASSYTIALFTGILNTLKVSALACLLATAIGFTMGIARLSSNWLVRNLAFAYVEVIRNIPLLLQILFWYFAVLGALPGVRGSLTLGRYLALNNRGLFLPDPTATPALGAFLTALLAAFTGVYLWARYVRAQQEASGRQLPLLYPVLGILVGLPGLCWAALGAPATLSFPELQGFGFRGGLSLSPEFTAMLLGLSMYHGGFITEIVRSGILSVGKGQNEAARAVGLSDGRVMQLVVIPQALRVILPPLTSQYLGLTKNSSLGIAIAYPELVAVGMTSLNVSGQAIEIVGITMVVYLALSLTISLGMNWYNARVKLVER